MRKIHLTFQVEKTYAKGERYKRYGLLGEMIPQSYSIVSVHVGTSGT